MESASRTAVTRLIGEGVVLDAVAKGFKKVSSPTVRSPGIYSDEEFGENYNVWMRQDLSGKKTYSADGGDNWHKSIEEALTEAKKKRA